MRQPSVDQQSTARLFQAYFAAKILVSRFVAKTWPVFRSLWQESGMADPLQHEHDEDDGAVWLQAGNPGDPSNAWLVPAP